MELVRVDRREVLLGPQARDVDGVLAVGEDLLVLPCGFLGGATHDMPTSWTTEESAYLSRPLVRFPGVVGSKGISFGPTTTTLIGCVRLCVVGCIGDRQNPLENSRLLSGCRVVSAPRAKRKTTQTYN